MDSQINTQNSQMDKQMNRQIDKQTDGQIDRQVDRQKIYNRQTDKYLVKQRPRPLNFLSLIF